MWPQALVVSLRLPNLARVAHVQGCGKLRPTDNGKTSGHNSLSWADETIFASFPDRVIAAKLKPNHLV